MTTPLTHMGEVELLYTLGLGTDTLADVIVAHFFISLLQDADVEATFELLSSEGRLAPLSADLLDSVNAALTTEPDKVRDLVDPRLSEAEDPKSLVRAALRGAADDDEIVTRLALELTAAAHRS